MKKYLLYIFASFLVAFTSCQSPDEAPEATVRESLTSITATFSEGAYSEDKYPDAKFITKVANDNVEEIKIIIPWFFPEESDHLTDITKMRVRAELDNNCSISPELGILDLTKKNSFVLTNAKGESKTIIITGEIQKLKKCSITFFSAEDESMDISVTGIIDEEQGRISLVTADDLSSVKLDVSLSPHATISPEINDMTFDLNSEIQFTVTGQDGITKKTYTVITEVPDKVNYGFRPGSEKELFGFDFTRVGLVQSWDNNASLAAIGNYLIVSPGTGVAPVYFNRMTGAKLGSILLGAAKGDGCITSDLGGNLLICDKASGNGQFNIYQTKSVLKAPSLFFSYNNGTGLPISRVSVQGNIDGDAVIIATLDGAPGITNSNHFLRIPVSGGVVGDPVVVVTNGAGNWGGGPSGNTKVVAATTNAIDGYFFSYYDSDILYHVGSTGNADKSLGAQSDGSGWAMNNNRLDIKEFNNARYLVLACPPHFPQWGFSMEIYMYDVANLGTFTGNINNSPSMVFKTNAKSFLTGGEGVSANGDILLVPAGNGLKMHLYYIDHNTKSIGAWEFDCLKK